MKANKLDVKIYSKNRELFEPVYNLIPTRLSGKFHFPSRQFSPFVAYRKTNIGCPRCSRRKFFRVFSDNEIAGSEPVTLTESFTNRNSLRRTSFNAFTMKKVLMPASLSASSRFSPYPGSTSNSSFK